MSWLGAYVLQVDRRRRDVDRADPGERAPAQARRAAGSAAWLMPNGSLLLGVYGRIRGYGEEGENESTRSALLRSDDGGVNWEYYSTMAFDAASIVDYEEPAIVRLADGRIVGMLRTHVNPSGDAKNMAIVVSDDDGFSWTPPRFTNIWGYPAEFATLPDGRILMIYGYRRPPYGVRGCVSDDGVTWDVAERVHDPRRRRAGRVLRQSRRVPAHRLSERDAARRRQRARDVPRARRQR